MPQLTINWRLRFLSYDIYADLIIILKALGMISFDHTLSKIHIISLLRFFCSRNQRKRYSARSPNGTSWSKCTADVDRYTRQFEWSTYCLKFFSWLLDHVIYLKLTKFLLLLQAELPHKIHSKCWKKLSFWAKIYIPSTINNWKNLLTKAIWADKKGLVSDRLACTSSKTEI